MTGMQYQAFMDASFRRSGSVIYQPVCDGCRACESIRVRVSEYRPNKSQRRCLRKNADLSMQAATPFPTEEKTRLYKKYQLHCHASDESTWEGFVDFYTTRRWRLWSFAIATRRGGCWVWGSAMCAENL